MTDAPWEGDACSLVDAFRSGARSPVEELDAALAAIESSDLNCFSHVDEDRARAIAATADVELPFGGIPTGIKELSPVEGWPDTEASLVFRDRTATHTSHVMQRLFTRGGVVPVGQTTASEFGGLNVSVTKLNGVTHNPWRRGRTAGGSSGGSCAAVAGGIVALATGGDGGGSIRIPAAYTGLLGMKGTFGRFTRAPGAFMRPNTVVSGNVARSVRDAARYFDVCAGLDLWDPSTLPDVGGWEAGLGTHDLRGLRVAVAPALGARPWSPASTNTSGAPPATSSRTKGWSRSTSTSRSPTSPRNGCSATSPPSWPSWATAGPACASEMTDEMAIGLFLSQSLYNLHMAAVAEQLRVAANETMARAFEQVDLIIAATNPGPAFAADAAMSSDDESFIDWATSSNLARWAFRGTLFGARLGAAFAPKLPSALVSAVTDRFPELVGMGALTIISNVYGNPAVSVPIEPVDGLPFGMQVLAPRHRDGLLFDVALAVERERPWPLVAPRRAPVAAGADRTMAPKS